MRRILMAVALVLFTISSAQAAALRTIEFEATGLSTAGDPFGVLGLSGPVDTVTGSFTFDPMATPFLEQTNSPGSVFETDQTVSPYISFSVNVGGITLDGAPSTNNLNDRLFLLDGIGNLAGDVVEVSSFTDQTIAAGVILESLVLQALGAFDAFDGTGVPSVADLNSMNNRFRFQLIANNVSLHRADYDSITFTEVSAVPLPAALPLFLTMLAGMGFLRWRRNKRAVA